ncbi:AvrD family protein [Streptomyces rubradiris]|uniref:Avirulence D protein (AvrD) n=1 Tax=Streptomyces rubradiris TaxID=285531 RepID=A0ABQ3RF26_STRRR|nr:AvrD family protein [Streptomyces rubradiris]GHG97519.1 hypothetical protein GCM10018792_09420 [Streptomyces rubradiris]GHI54440.1 hypothetical protein Srubr_42860 [Streptomyces rubradiris]
MSVRSLPVTRSVDDYLGPGDNRFFGAGFRRIRHALRGITVTSPAPGAGRLRATAALSYPPDWSAKPGKAPLRPHLSSIDALVLGVQLCEIMLTHAHGLDGELRRAMWLRHYEMRSGASPQEELADFPAELRLVSTTRCPDPLSSAALSVLDCRIGSLRVRFEIVHPGTPHRAGDMTYASVEEALGPAAQRFYGERYKLRAHRIDDIRLDPAAPRLTALVAVTARGRQDAPDPGLGGAFPHTLSMVDATIVLAQTAQILLYDLDGIDRADSNTLWMRRISMTAGSPAQPMLHPFVGATSIERSKTLTMAGRPWRTADFAGDLQGIHADYSLAHQLPGPNAPAH